MRPVSLFCLLGLSVLLLIGSTSQASAQTYRSRWPIVIADATAGGGGTADRYPSVVTVSAPADPTWTLRRLEIQLYGLAHPRLEDLDILLVPPAASGRPSVLLLSDTGGSVAMTDEEALRFVAGSGRVPHATAINPRATFVGTDALPADSFPGVTPGAITTDLTALDGMNPAGEWSLYIVDDQPGETGAVGAGWSLEVYVGPPAFTSSAGPFTIDSPTTPGVARAAVTPPITVSGLVGAVTSMRLILNGLTHTRPDDLEIYLQAPNGWCFQMLGDQGGVTPVSNLSMTIDSAPRVSYRLQRDEDPLYDGLVGVMFPHYAPPPDVTARPPSCSVVWHGVFLNNADVFSGDWQLHVYDDRQGEDGSLQSWGLEFSHLAPGAWQVLVDQERGETVTQPLVSSTLTGSISAPPDGVPSAFVRWRIRTVHEFGDAVPISYEEGPWVVIDPQTGTWALPDVPFRWGKSTVVIEALDGANNIRAVSNEMRFDLEQPRYTLSEGATSDFFDLDVIVFNPSAAAARAEVTFLRQGNTPIVQTLELGPSGRRRLAVNEIPGLAYGQISAIVRPITVSPLVVERAMFWDRRRYGGHAANAVQPAREWFFAEGAQNAFFQTYFPVANPTDAPLTIDLEFQLEGNTSGQPLRRSITLGANTRETIDIGTFTALHGQTFGARLSAPAAFVAERAMYFGTGARLWEGGHESTGATRAASTWLLAEGATGTFFETYVLVSNPSASATTVTMDFLLPDGRTIQKSRPLGAYGRLSVNIEHEHPDLAQTAVATRVSASIPIVVERAMYWPGHPGDWTEAHNGFGLTRFERRWALADGRIGGPLGYATYILVANPTDYPTVVTATFVRNDGERFTTERPVDANSRETIDAGAVLPASWLAQAAEFSVTLDSFNSMAPIGVERATYWSSTDGIHWAGGANVQGTPIP